MPFAALAKIAAAKILPKIAPKVAAIIPKALPAVRTVLGGIGKSLGTAGAAAGGMAGYEYATRPSVPDYDIFGNDISGHPGAPKPWEPRIDLKPIAGAKPGAGGAMGPLMMTGRGAVRAAPGGAGYAVGVTAGRAVRGLIDQFGRKWSARRVAALTRRIGVEAAAAALGVGAVAVVQMIAQDSMTAVRRRRKGISYSQLNTTRKTLRRFEAMNRYLCKPTTTTRRKACR